MSLHSCTYVLKTCTDQVCTVLQRKHTNIWKTSSHGQSHKTLSFQSERTFSTLLSFPIGYNFNPRNTQSVCVNLYLQITHTVEVNVSCIELMKLYFSIAFIYWGASCRIIVAERPENC